MPELPEVETTLKGISKGTLHKKITSFFCRDRKLRWPIPADMSSFLKNQSFESAYRRGKYLILILANAKGSVLIHLGMSGRIILTSNNENSKFKHTHMTLYFKNNLIAKFIDPRRFGCILLFDTKAISKNRLFSHLGPEPLSKQFNPNYLERSCQNKKASIKSVIMNQSIVVGIGNIYASESLFRSGINPKRKAFNITYEQCVQLVKNIKFVPD